MQGTSWKGPLFLFITIVLIVAAVVYVRPILFEKEQRATSDAPSSSEQVRAAGDDYSGYFVINSPEMKKQAPRSGLELKFILDGGAYADRLEKFANGDYDLIVIPIAEYIRHGLKHKYPGVIVSGIAGSRGADAIVGFPDVMPTGKINDLDDPSLRWVYVNDSPSEFLIDLTVVDFDLARLQQNDSWRHEVGTIDEVYELAKAAVKDRSKGDIFVLWEPYVMTAVEKLGMKVLWSSKDFAGYIEDVFVFHRDFVKKDKGQVAFKFLQTYFRVFDLYAANKEKFLEELGDYSNLKGDRAKKILDEIDFYDLQENCSQLFGIQLNANVASEEKLVNSTIACTNVLARVGKFDASQLSDPYRIINSSLLEDLAKSGIRAVGSATNGPIDFPTLSDTEWKRLKEVGTMRVEPIVFQQGTNRLDEYGGKDIVDQIAQMLKVNYPNYRVAVRGHTGPGDETANLALSAERAQVVAQRLIAVHGIDPDRLNAEGWGNSQPPSRKPGESTRSWQLRMPRVEFVLLEGSSL